MKYDKRDASQLVCVPFSMLRFFPFDDSSADRARFHLGQQAVRKDYRHRRHQEKENLPWCSCPVTFTRYLPDGRLNP